MINKNNTTRLNEDILIPQDILTYLILGMIVALLSLNIFQLYIVTGDSMYPNLKDNEKILIKKINFDYEVGDIIGFKEGDEKLIKRIVAREGDVIEIIDRQLYISSAAVKDTYIASYIENSYEGEIPSGFVYVLGDNRYASCDSRSLGLVNIKTIIGSI